MPGRAIVPSCCISGISILTPPAPALPIRCGGLPDDSFACEECSDADEAQKIADHYQRIITAIERQIEEQGGW